MIVLLSLSNLLLYLFETFITAMLTFRDLAKYLRVLRLRACSDPIVEDYRGWNWFREPIKPPGYRGLAISDFAYMYCSTLRNVYLKYVLKVEQRITKPLMEGIVLHEVLYKAIEDVKRIMYSEGELQALTELIDSVESTVEQILENVLSTRAITASEEFERDLHAKACALYRHVVLYYMGELQRVLSELVDLHVDTVLSHVIPQFSQFHIDGYLVGLSRRLIVDALMPGVIVEFKFGNNVDPANVATALAGYAIAIESDYEIPIDFGLVVKIAFLKVRDRYVPRVSVTPVYLSNEVRHQFLTLRDEAYDIIYSEKDPGLSKNCSESCPYYHVCRGDSS